MATSRCAANKNGYSFDPEDTIQDVIKEIIKREHFGELKNKHTVKDERKKVQLAFKGETLSDESTTLKALDVKENDVLTYTIAKPLIPDAPVKDE